MEYIRRSNINEKQVNILQKKSAVRFLYCRLKDSISIMIIIMIAKKEHYHKLFQTEQFYFQRDWSSIGISSCCIQWSVCCLPIEGRFRNPKWQPNAHAYLWYVPQEVASWIVICIAFYARKPPGEGGCGVIFLTSVKIPIAQRFWFS